MLGQAAIRKMTAEELPFAVLAEQACFTDPWTEGMIADSLDNGLDVWLVLYEDGTPAGYCVVRIIAGEGELLRIGVLPALRGRGLGKKLMDGVVETSRHFKVSALSLEVRESNTAARNLYKSYGFEKEAVRTSYYSGPSEDAVIMWNRRV